jgi:curli biogenesis system outer membrane secretion channel CsgG
MPSRKLRRQMGSLLALLVFLGGCATSSGPHGASSAVPPDTATPVRFPPYEGRKRKVQVVQIRIPLEDAKRYPELAEKRVGFGLSNILVDTLFDTGRFVLLEEKGEILKRLVEQWELTEDGILARDPAAQKTNLQAAEFLVYAEVFDFVACSPIERLGLVRKSLTCVTSVGVQVRFVNAATGEYIPGSTDPLSPEGKYVHRLDRSLFADATTAFDQSAVGKATLKATRYAVLKALKRFERAGW